MAANWEGFNTGLGDIGKALGDRAKEQRAKDEAIQMMYQKALIEQQISQMDPYKQGILKYINAFMPQNNPIDTTGIDESGKTIGGGGAPMSGMGGRGDYWLKPSFGPSGPSLSMEMTPEAQSKQKVKEQSMLEESKPLAGEASVRYSGALQGVRDLQKITDLIGLQNGDIKNIDKAKNLIYKANLNIEGVGAERGLPFLTGLYRGVKLSRAGDEGAKLGNLFMTLSENLLRARTGAQAPEPEVIREYARSLLKSFIESPDTWKSKLMQNEEFLLGTVKSLRPNTWQKDLGSYKSVIFNKSGKTSSGIGYTIEE